MTAPKSEARPIRPLGVGLGLFALLLQLILPVSLAIASVNAGPDSYRFGLCLSNGGNRIILGFDDPADTSQSFDCPFCIAAKHIPLSMPERGALHLTEPGFQLFHYPMPANHMARSDIAQQRPWIRGPPTF